MCPRVRTTTIKKNKENDLVKNVNEIRRDRICAYVNTFFLYAERLAAAMFIIRTCKIYVSIYNMVCMDNVKQSFRFYVHT